MIRPTSASDRVFAMPELLDMVFTTLEDAHNVNNALVSKRWSDVALDSLWRSVNDLYRLFRLLAPLGECLPPRGQYVFTRVPDPTDWERFTTYARRVRCLEYNEALQTRRFADSVWDDVARTRTSIAVLPNLTRLAWLGSTDFSGLRFAVTLMHENVRQFAIRLPSYPAADVYPVKQLHSFVQNVVGRMESLVTLDLRMNSGVAEVEKEVIVLLHGLQKLRKVVVPAYWLTSDIVTELAKLPSLQVVQYEFFEAQGTGEIDDVQIFRPTLREGSFPSLFDLSFTAALCDAAYLLSSPHAPSTLTHLYIQAAGGLESPLRIHALLALLPTTLAALTQLVLELRGFPDQLAHAPTEEHVITLATLRPLCALPALRAFELCYDAPLALDDADAAELARGLPEITTLHLGCEPFAADIGAADTRPRLTLAALAPFARYCPNLVSLGLFLDVSAGTRSTVASAPGLSASTSISTSTSDSAPSSPAPSSSAPEMPPRVAFRALRSLSVGASPLAAGAAGALALWLSDVLPLGCTLLAGYTWESYGTYTPPDGARDESARRCAEWAEVDKMLPVLTRMKYEARDRRSALEREVEDLRVRNRILMESAGMRGGADCMPF